MESVASLQKINLDMASLDEEEARVKSLQEKLEKSIKQRIRSWTRKVFL